MIPKDIIDKVIDATNIQDVVQETVTLRKAGANLTGLCPFHNEKTPSFIVSPAKNAWHCYGCHQGGDAIKFVMLSKALSFPEAIHHLARKVNITIEEKEADPEAQEKAQKREQVFILNEHAATFYQQQLHQNPDILAEVRERFSDEEISLWRIGYAPDAWDSLIKNAAKAGFNVDMLIEASLAKTSDKNNSNYDFFRHRIIFPIFNKYGRVSGFSGRITKNAKDKAKYINLSKTPTYDKSSALYGIHLAAKSMHSDGAFLVEGNPDVIRMHSVEATNTVAPCGTAVTDQQLAIIRKLTDTITILTDGDKAGQDAILKTGKLALEKKFKVYCAILPQNEDPASFFKTTEFFNDWIHQNTQNFIILLANNLFTKASTDPAKKNDAVKEICSHLFFLDDASRSIYIDQIAKNNKLKPKLFTDKLRDLDQDNIQYEHDDALPEGIDPREFQKWGFYEHNNRISIQTKYGIEEISNFVMKPVFHIEGSESRRVYELINFKGYKIVVDLDMQEMTSIQAFRRNIEGRGNFIFSGTDAQFTRIKSKLYEETRTCSLIKVPGWQKEGFWAWSNGITTEKGFSEIDEYGVIEFNKNNYFIPAFSSVYIDNKSVFISERKFLFRDRKISMFEWSCLFQEVFGDNAKIGICFWIAAIFRDFVLFLNKNFPILNLFGPKGTGKSQMAMSLSCLFGEQQTPFNIHNGTKAGLAEHLQQFCNAFAWVDEYKNNLDYDKIETLKSVYDAIGRNRLNEKLQKQTTLVNSAMILSGQEMPTADVALYSRLIFLLFNKTDYSEAEKKSYDKLKNLERDGLAHLSHQIIVHRAHFEKEFYNNMDFVISDIFNELKEEFIEDRILRSWCTIAAALRTMQNKVNFGFGYSDIRSIVIDGIRNQNSQVSKSNEIGQFWDLIEALYDENTLIEGWHFRVTPMDKIKTSTSEKQFKEPKLILRFKFNSIAKIYAESCRKSGLKPLPSDTLSYYLKNSKAFIGIQPSLMFSITQFSQKEGRIVTQKTITSAFCFDYLRLGINLTRALEGETLPNAADTDENSADFARFNDKKTLGLNLTQDYNPNNNNDQPHAINGNHQPDNQLQLAITNNDEPPF